MALVINEEQSMLKASAREYLLEKAPVEALRKLRDTADPKGYDTALWQEMAEMGWAGIVLPEAYGGLNFDYVGFGQLLEEMGRTLTASPMVSTVLLSSTAINLMGNETQKEKYLPEIASGAKVIAFAIDESAQHRPHQIKSTAQQTEHGFIINGKKQFVLDGHVADHFIVVASTSGNESDKDGISLFLVDAQADGIEVERTIMMDSRNAAIVKFTNVAVLSDNLLGTVGGAWKDLERVLDIARIGLSAEMLGSMQEAFDRTLAYIKDRQQFGVSIAVFQALQHRAANMYCEIELCKSLVIKSLTAIDQGQEDLAELASITKAKVGETIKLVSNEGVQMFGGIGMTDDEEIGFFLKRARVAQHTLGDYNYHLDRYAKMKGY
jgi:acyl-CoA dehydrogenase